jgi:hypothetical protein
MLFSYSINLKLTYSFLAMGEKKKERKKERSKTCSWQESYGGLATNKFCPTFLFKITDFFVTHYTY